MATTQPIAIHSFAEDGGGRRVRADDRFVGLAYGLRVLRLAGLGDVDRVAWWWP
jgi:hypothetical protein